MSELWTRGYSHAELEEAQERYDLRFPPDLLALLSERRLVEGYDWSREDPRIREMLRWPYEMLLFDVEHGLWWPAWGDRPAEAAGRDEVLRTALAGVFRLIPLYVHRFLPEVPCEAGNPVFSMHGFDTIYYGCDLGDYPAREFDGAPLPATRAGMRHIDFWSDIVEQPDIPQRCYEEWLADVDQSDLPPAVKALRVGRHGDG